MGILAWLVISAGAGGASPQDDGKVERLVRQLGADSVEERDGAEEKIETLGVDAVPALVRSLKDADAEIRARARRLLNVLSTSLPDALLKRYPLLKTLRTRKTVFSLVRKMEKESLTSLPHFRHPGNYLTLFPKYQELVRIGKPAVLPLLRIARDKTKKAQIRYFAAILLGRIGDPRAVQGLLHLLWSPSEFTYGAG